MEQPAYTRFPGYHIMVKPAGPRCNLGCRYCFYLEKEALFPGDSSGRMSLELLERFTQQYIESQHAPEITFAWQGGEPTLLGVEFFRKAVEFQRRYAQGKRILNAFQTNGVLLDDPWGAFLAEHDFLVGLSIDGPQAIHDRYRLDKGGTGTFSRVLRGMEMLKKHGVEFNTLTCVQRHNARQPLEVYRFLREVGSGFMQFIPVVERQAAPDADGLTLTVPGGLAEAQVTEWSVRPDDYGRFLCAIFDEWVRKDVGGVFVQLFDISLEAWMGMEPSLCIFHPTCGEAMALEHDGSLYSCDHYVYPEFRLGNLNDAPLASLVDSDFQREFGEAKRSTLPRCCRACPLHFVCHGDCPKHRFLTSLDGEPGLSYLCDGYKSFFRHADPYMRFMANELRAQRPAANIMAYVRRMDLEAEGKSQPSPNELCVCGSGKKFKKCCGRMQ